MPTGSRNPTAEAIMEVQAYQEEPLLPKNADPGGKVEPRYDYPRHSKLMAKRLCVVATSVPSVRNRTV